MNLFKHELRIDDDEAMILITDLVREDVRASGIDHGIVVIFSPHSTAGITINENTDPHVRHDLLYVFDRLIPRNDDAYEHEDGNSFAHIKSSVIGASETLIVENGRMILGIWQDIYFCEFDGPRTRTFYVKVMEG